ncbi:LpqB family beta-propeller domain-containing protein [Glycomyces sp. NRRL B-16210]|uniref:LpqB family beta-propeller domain-containing protein n=1 Tax=Glycomyces sp. NRRL B-16210 TaxID=1463821 RepID=UPI0004C1B6FB|nr:LpqB family beta-propeller domain-containing protein [Glycomyces sp. NRRL B-16210]
MRRRTSLTAAVALGTTWVLSACGIPAGKAPEVMGDAPSDFDQSSGTSAETFAPTTNAEETVQNFLKAAAGEADGRNDRLHSFTVDAEQQFSDLSAGLDLLAGVDVAIGADSLESATVKVTGSVVGTYLPDGSVRMHSAPRAYDESFTLQREGLQDIWKIATLPTQVMLDYNQFSSDYGSAPLYFQAGMTELLVPDIRWIYNDLDAETDRRQRLEWLVQGPSDFVAFSARNAIPEGTLWKTSNDDGTARIDLTRGETVDSDTASAIAAQIAWSLGLSGEFVLAIDGEAVVSGALRTWRSWNAIPASLGNQENGYFIADETVWEYTGSLQVTAVSEDHPWVGFSVEGLRQVAVGPSGKIAAIVDGGGRDVLQVGSTTSMRALDGGLGGDLSDPQWLGSRTVVVIDDGVPTTVDSSSGSAQTLAVGTDVTAMSIAADGRRLAFVEEGVAWVAPISVDADGNIQAGEPRRIGLDISDVTDVAWSTENYLWVAGLRGDDKLFRVAIDNSRIEVQKGIGGVVIEQIAANPADPVESNLNWGEPVLVVSDSTLYRVFVNGPDAVDNEGQLVQASSPFTVLR